MERQLSHYKVSRRAFLATLPLAAAAASCRRRPFRREDFIVPDRSSMAILPASSYDIDLADVIYRGLEMVQPSVAGRRVFLKPNMVEYESGTAINTHPSVVAGGGSALAGTAGSRAYDASAGP